MRFTRLKDIKIPAPPLANDQTFRIAHDAKRLYYLGMHDKKKKLVVVWLQNLCYQFLDLAKDQEIQTFKDSSLIRNYLCYRKDNPKTKKKDFFVLDIKNQMKVWEMRDVEKFFFAGKDEAKMDAVNFKENGGKLLKKNEKLPELFDPDEDEDIEDRVLVTEEREF